MFLCIRDFPIRYIAFLVFKPKEKYLRKVEEQNRRLGSQCCPIYATAVLDAFEEHTLLSGW